MEIKYTDTLSCFMREYLGEKKNDVDALREF